MPDRPEALIDAFVAAWNKADADALAELFVEDADFVNVVGMWWTSRSQIRYNHAYGFRHMFSETTLSPLKVSARYLNGDVAVLHLLSSLTGQVKPSGERAGDRIAVLTFTVARQSENHWLVVSAQNTDRVPGAQTFISNGSELTPGNYERRSVREEPMK
ncbi:conserved hypothetical protein [Arthrobacter subterraneus]|uniref:SnoaL-like domain-containing protein n=1 Tax=Arthrobacter subterraneus TaxID=335973 RepID=A0A1G8NU73_9MICC|nr:SgcJ/EcaC family oxidoreductase [Arthrobacter subterraneus]SDI83799.1 conserved hypothetical protein [Arthrobacter subterraneus]